MLDWGSVLVGIVVGGFLFGLLGAVLGYLLCESNGEQAPYNSLLTLIRPMLGRLKRNNDMIVIHFTMGYQNDDDEFRGGSGDDDDDDGDLFPSPGPTSGRWSNN